MGKNRGAGVRARTREEPLLCPFTGGTCNKCAWWTGERCSGHDEVPWDMSPRDWYLLRVDEAARG